MTDSTAFPKDFIWGAASKSYQIEGSPLADGATASIQHRFALTPGNTYLGQTGEVAADSYRRSSEDVKLMSELGLSAYQFSVSWPRVIPDGVGRFNQKGLDHYDALIDLLLDAGISPSIMLYDWALPGDLQDAGGWANRDCARWFADYAALLFDRYGDRVTHWFTICEPVSVAFSGYVTGRLAPAMRDLYAGLKALHHVTLGHGLAVQAMRASDAIGQIGTSSLVVDVRSASDISGDIAAAARVNSYFNELFLDPILLGSYPPEIVDWFGEAWPSIEPDDMKVTSEPIDFVGVTYYYATTIAERGAKSAESSGAGTRVAIDQALNHMANMLDVAVVPWEGETTGIDWPVQPDGLYNVLAWIADRYGQPPIIVTENGSAWPDPPDGQEDSSDPDRVDYLSRHLAQAHRAIADGVDLRGWFVWALMDTWEFSMGFRGRFGLVHVDFDSHSRTIRESGRWYSRVSRANALPD